MSDDATWLLVLSGALLFVAYLLAGTLILRRLPALTAYVTAGYMFQWVVFVMVLAWPLALLCAYLVRLWNWITRDAWLD